jgi:hypothetical protein
MLGLCGIIVLQLVLICLVSYWISWEMQHKEKRAAFGAQVWNDIVDSFGKRHGAIRNRGLRSLAAKHVRVTPANCRKSRETPVLTGAQLS